MMYTLRIIIDVDDIHFWAKRIPNTITLFSRDWEFYWNDKSPDGRPRKAGKIIFDMPSKIHWEHRKNNFDVIISDWPSIAPFLNMEAREGCIAVFTRTAPPFDDLCKALRYCTTCKGVNCPFQHLPALISL